MSFNHYVSKMTKLPQKIATWIIPTQHWPTVSSYDYNLRKSWFHAWLNSFCLVSVWRVLSFLCIHATFEVSCSALRLSITNMMPCSFLLTTQILSITVDEYYSEQLSFLRKDLLMSVAIFLSKEAGCEVCAIHFLNRLPSIKMTNDKIIIINKSINQTSTRRNWGIDWYGTLHWIHA